MGSIRDIHNVFRDNLIPASFRGALFHVETSSRSSGRRTVVHQYPKRNLPYAEDMGREAVHWQFTGYLILGDHGFPGNLISQMAELIGALEADEGGLLVHPLLPEMFVVCERYSYSDKRTTGGYVEFDMQFVEAGVAAMSMSIMDSGTNLTNSAETAEASATSGIQSGTSSLQGSSGLTSTGQPAGII